RELERARRRAAEQGSSVEIIAASEGLELNLEEPTARPARAAGNGARGAFLAPTGRVLLAGSNLDGIKEVRDAIGGDGHDITTAHDGSLASAGAKIQPDLLILVGAESETALLDTARQARAEKWAASVPILVLAGSEGPGASGRLVDGLTDVLSRPFNPAILRPRVRALLSRTGTSASLRAVPQRHRFPTP